MFYRLMTQSAHWLVGDMPIMMLLQLSYWAPVQTLHMLSMRTQFLNGLGYFPSPAIWSVVQFPRSWNGSIWYHFIVDNCVSTVVELMGHESF
jgi:hypothetical protein